MQGREKAREVKSQSQSYQSRFRHAMTTGHFPLPVSPQPKLNEYFTFSYQTHTQTHAPGKKISSLAGLPRGCVI